MTTQAGEPEAVPIAPPCDEDRAVIQGLVARNYDRMKAVRHIVLKVENSNAARDFILKYMPNVAVVKDDGAEFCLNIGFTFRGLSAFLEEEQCKGLREKRELEAFVQGAVDRAGLVGDIGPSAPRLWKGELGRPEKVDLVVSVFAVDTVTLQRECARIVADAQAGFGNPVSSHDGNVLPDGTIHFGYKDGISQPNISDLRNNGDNQEQVPAGAFVLGYESQFKGHRYDFDFPEELGRNGTFAAFRIMKQDVHAFEKYLDKEAGLSGNRELVAAKLCGRWRDGTPLVIADNPGNKPINNFKYQEEDPQGMKCPFSAHIRRTNPRDDKVAGLSGKKHRIVRATMPYGKPYDAAKNNYTEGQQNFEERGLIGLFLCVNLADQFEFIMKNWVIRGGFNGHLGVSDRDPLIGIEQFVQTRGAAYLFMPSLVGLKYLAEGKKVASVGG